MIKSIKMFALAVVMVLSLSGVGIACAGNDKDNLSQNQTQGQLQGQTQLQTQGQLQGPAAKVHLKSSCQDFNASIILFSSSKNIKSVSFLFWIVS